MMALLRYLLLVATGVVSCVLPMQATAQSPIPTSSPRGTCTGNWINPITDVCWECLGPITLGSTILAQGNGGSSSSGPEGPLPFGQPPSKKKDFGNPSNPICACSNPVPRIGLAIGFYEPARAVDVTRTPWCFPNLGGLQIDVGVGYKGGAKRNVGPEGRLDVQHVHWYVYPLLSILNIATEALCLQPSGFGLGYVTELDPLWRSDALSLIIHPEAGLFANLPAQLVCAADCAAATADLPVPELFWCQGCHGSTYPVTGNLNHTNGEGHSAILAAERMTFKLHRQLIEWKTSGEDVLCNSKPMPIVDKRQYRYQLVNPKALTKGRYTCPPTGSSTVFWDRSITTPVTAKDFGFLVWRKRNCCAL